VDEQIYLFGGYCHELTKFELSYRYPIDVHVFNSQTLAWTKRPVPTKDDPQFNFTPFFRYGHTCVTYKDRIYLWGGRSHWSHSLDTNLYVYYPSIKNFVYPLKIQIEQVLHFLLEKHIWNIVETKGTSPYGRDGHSACIYKNQMLIFGGYVEILKKFSNEIYSFDFLTSTWTNIVPKVNIFYSKIQVKVKSSEFIYE
jgi:N-acetylneuraminic acid mutarotase